MRQHRHKNAGSIADVLHYSTPGYNNFRDDSKIRAGESQMIYAATKGRKISFKSIFTAS